MRSASAITATGVGRISSISKSSRYERENQRVASSRRGSHSTTSSCGSLRAAKTRIPHRQRFTGSRLAATEQPVAEKARRPWRSSSPPSQSTRCVRTSSLAGSNACARTVTDLQPCSCGSIAHMRRRFCKTHATAVHPLTVFAAASKNFAAARCFRLAASASGRGTLLALVLPFSQTMETTMEKRTKEKEIVRPIGATVAASAKPWRKRRQKNELAAHAT